MLTFTAVELAVVGLLLILSGRVWVLTGRVRALRETTQKWDRLRVLREEDARDLAQQRARELEEERRERRKAEERLIHHLATMRREGYTAQPEDDEWGPYVLTPEVEAEIEEKRRADEGEG
jgi:hypothetical protein